MFAHFQMKMGEIQLFFFSILVLLSPHQSQTQKTQTDTQNENKTLSQPLPSAPHIRQMGCQGGSSRDIKLVLERTDADGV